MSDSDVDKQENEVNLKKKLAKVESALSVVEKKISVLVRNRDELHKEKLEIKQKIQKEATRKLQKIDWSNTEHPWFAKMDKLLKTVFKLKLLRSYQLPCINAVMQKQCTILIMPTGGGKSLCYQLPALLLPGVTLVISPLVSLMEDQVMALKSLKIDADLIHGGKSQKENSEVEKKMVEGELKLIYCTPERLAKSKRFMSKLEKCYAAGKLSLLAIDEVHCCSQWGHDFRKDYNFLGIMRKQFPKVPILGLTATAPSNVLEDVQSFLKLEGCLVFKAPLNRPNLFYEVRQKSANHKQLVVEIANLISDKFPNESGIVYCFSIKDSLDLASELRENGVKARAYHGNMEAAERKKVHTKWVNGDIHVIVATIAFGMGIDKPDVRFVIHHSMSKSMESYYQESGRAGRDGKQSRCILYYRLGDMFRQSCMVFAERTGLEKLYGMVAYCIDQTRCRREVIAQHFGEDWDDDCCQNMCDSCLNADSMESTDVTNLCKVIYKILDKAETSDERMTAIKLLDTIEGKSHSKLRPTNYEIIPFSRETMENILALLLVEGYLEEDFHFTPYSTISYLKHGTKSSLVREENVEVIFNLPKFKRNIDLNLRKSLPITIKPKITATASASSSKTPSKSTKKEKREPVTYSEKTNKKIKLEIPKPVVIDSDSESNCEIILDDSFGKF